MTWVTCHITVPVACVPAANRLAAVLDPDTGGGHTFGVFFTEDRDEAGAPTHSFTVTGIDADYLALIQTDNAEAIHAALSTLAQSRTREAPSLEDCQDFLREARIELCP